MIDSLLFFGHSTGKVIFEKVWHDVVSPCTKRAYISYLLCRGGLDGPPFVHIDNCSFMHVTTQNLIIVLTSTKNMNACLLGETLREILKCVNKLLHRKEDDEFSLEEADISQGCVEIFEFLEDNIECGFPNFCSLDALSSVLSPPVRAPSSLGLWYVLGGSVQAAKVPLRSLVFDVCIKQSACEVSMTQVYLNDQPREIEAVFIFPLSSSAAVCGFHVVINDRIVQGVVKAKSEARREYVEAKERGHGAYLLAQNRPDVFELNVGNIPSNTCVTLILRYVSELLIENDFIKFSLPLSVLPSSPIAQQTVNVRVECTSIITSLTTPSHCAFVKEMKMVGCSGFLSVDLCQTSQEFVLCISQADIWTPFACVEYDEYEETHAVLLSFVPDLGKKNIVVVNTELLIVVDCSGSMNEHQRIQQAASTLSAVIHALPSSCFFNVVSFGTHFKFLFPTSVSCAEEENCTKALEFAKTMSADMGGTEILKPLETIFASPLLAGYTRQIFLLTDGEVTDSSAVSSLVRNHARNTRVFTFGIGVGASLTLCQETALAGGGKAEMINEATELRACVLRQLARALQPSVTDISIYWGGLHITQAPCVLRPLFHGEPYRVYALIHRGEGARGKSDIIRNNRSSSGDKCFSEHQKYHAKLSGRLADGSSVHFNLMIQPSKIASVSACAFAPPGGPAVSSPLVIHTLFARELIRDLELGCSILHLPLQRCAEVLMMLLEGQKYLCQIVLFYLHDERKEATLVSWQPTRAQIEQEIERVGVRYSLVSVQTSFIAIEKREKGHARHLDFVRAKNKEVPSALTGSVSWRSEMISYRTNEVFVDVIERMECEWSTFGGLKHVFVYGTIKMKCFISGVYLLVIGASSTLLKSIDRLHQSVNSRKFDQCRTLKLTPPHGEFELASYTLDAELVRVPLQICVDAKFTKSKLIIFVKLVVTIPKDKKAQCVITLPLNELCDSVIVSCAKGRASWVSEKNEVAWSIDAYGGSSAVLRVECTTPECFAEGCAKLVFQVSEMLCSDAKIDYVNTVGKACNEVRYHMRSLTTSKHYLCPYRVGVL